MQKKKSAFYTWDSLYEVTDKTCTQFMLKLVFRLNFLCPLGAILLTAKPPWHISSQASHSAFFHLGQLKSGAGLHVFFFFLRGL